MIPSKALKAEAERARTQYDNFLHGFIPSNMSNDEVEKLANVARRKLMKLDTYHGDWARG